MIKLVAIDIDGTLFNSKKEISQENINALRELKSQGIYVVLATGRPVLGSLDIIRQLDFLDESDYIISTNGATVSKVKSGEILNSSVLKGDDVLRIYKESLKHDLNIMAYMHDETLVTNTDSIYSRKYTINNNTPAKVIDFSKIKSDDEFLITILPCDTKERLDLRIANFDQSIINDYQFIRAHKFSIDISKKNTDKGEALIFLTNHLNISMDNVMAFGDANNDLNMIKYAKIGVAMGNANDEIKVASDFVTLCHDQSGVAHAINKFIFNN